MKKQQSHAFGEVQPTYPLGTEFAPPESCLPQFVCDAMREAIPQLERGLRGFCRPDAVLTAPETRSSSPVRILRSMETLESLSVSGLYPCGEGAGFAGGITSASVDGIKTAEKLCLYLDKLLNCQQSD